MKIFIAGSMHFAKQMLETKRLIDNMGHEALIPSDTEDCVKNPGLNMDFEHCVRTQIDKECFDKIEESDAILILNYPKNGISGYVGGATLMEIGVARHLNKKIFFLHGLPREEELRYALEIKLTQPIVLRGELENLSEYM